LPEGDYRIDTYGTHDNLGVWLDKSCLEYFGSTAAPSILRFYPAANVKRDVRSEPELSNYALRGLLSVEYMILDESDRADFEKEADDGWTYYDTLDGFALYRNDNYVPMGFTYEYYTTEQTYEAVTKSSRSLLLMRALVLSEEDAETYGQYLSEATDEVLEGLNYTRYVEDCAARRAAAADSFTMTNNGFQAEITLEKENLVFFSVPYDDGFTAYVNGEEAEIVCVDEGLMAVLCPAGENRIDFVYEADGLELSRKISLAGLALFALYVGAILRSKKKRTTSRH
jgi:hypothetical protein